MIKPMLVKRKGWKDFGQVLYKTMEKIQNEGGKIIKVDYHPIFLSSQQTSYTAVITYDDTTDDIHLNKGSQ